MKGCFHLGCFTSAKPRSGVGTAARDQGLRHDSTITSDHQLQVMGAKIAALQGELLETQEQAAQQLATSLQQQAGLAGQVERLTAQVALLQQASSSAAEDLPETDVAGVRETPALGLEHQVLASTEGRHEQSKPHSHQLYSNSLDPPTGSEMFAPGKFAIQGRYIIDMSSRVHDWMDGDSGVSGSDGAAATPAVVVPDIHTVWLPDLHSCSTERVPSSSRRSSGSSEVDPPFRPAPEPFSLSSLSSFTVPAVTVAAATQQSSPDSEKCLRRARRGSVPEGAADMASIQSPGKAYRYQGMVGRSAVPSAYLGHTASLFQAPRHGRRGSSCMTVRESDSPTVINHNRFHTPPDCRTPHSSFACPETSELPACNALDLHQHSCLQAGVVTLSPRHLAGAVAQLRVSHGQDRIRRLSQFAVSHHFGAGLCTTPSTSFNQPNLSSQHLLSISLMTTEVADTLGLATQAHGNANHSPTPQYQPATSAAAALFTPGVTASLMSRFAAAQEEAPVSRFVPCDPPSCDVPDVGLPDFGSYVLGSFALPYGEHRTGLLADGLFPDTLKSYPGWALTSPAQDVQQPVLVSRENSSQMGQCLAGVANDGNHILDENDSNGEAWSYGRPLPHRADCLVLADGGLRNSRYRASPSPETGIHSDSRRSSGVSSISSDNSSSSSSTAVSRQGQSSQGFNTPSTGKGSVCTQEERGSGGSKSKANASCRPEWTHSPSTPCKKAIGSPTRGRGALQFPTTARHSQYSPNSAFRSGMPLLNAPLHTSPTSQHRVWEFQGGGGAAAGQAKTVQGERVPEHFVFQQDTGPSSGQPAGRIMSLVGLRRKHMGLRKQALFQSNLDETILALEQEIRSKKNEFSRPRPTERPEPPTHLASQELSLDLFSHLGTTANVLQLEQQLMQIQTERTQQELAFLYPN